MDLEGPEGGGGRILISQPKISTKSIVPEHKSHHLSGCPAQILIPFPFSIVLLLMNPSPSADEIPFSHPKKSKSQFPRFRTLDLQLNSLKFAI